MSSFKFILFSNCVITKGSAKIVIQDLQLNQWYELPLNVLEGIEILESKSLHEIGLNFNLEEVEILEYYLDFLLKSELGFVTDVPKYAFPSLELIWDSPYKITNLIVNLSNLNVNFDKFIPFQIQNLTIICDEKIEFNNKVFQCDPQSIYLVLNYSKNWRQIVKKYLCCFKNVSLVIINNSEIERDFITVHYVLKFTKKYSDKSIFSFEISNQLFLESQRYHTYFNRKLYIGIDGEIKNAFECFETFGNINEIKTPEKFEQIISAPDFQKYWFVNKEITDICKDCEFRLMCVDNRLPYQRVESEWYHKIDCNYNPYIAKWKGEEGYQTLEECGVISNEHGFSINYKKIAKINAVLWDE